MVIWLIGISDAGKTTLARMLQSVYQKKGIHTYLIDGDEVRSFFENDLGYSREDREMNIKRILFAAYLLEKNNVITIVANISPFESLRKMAREKLQNYHEIYLKKSLSSSIKNDVKGVYKAHLNKSELIGREIAFEEPSQPDLILPVEEQTPEESLQRILCYLEGCHNKDAHTGN